MFQSRTHTCNELRLENAGEQVRIVGWMENVREVGQNFAFVVVRDFYGTTQVVIETEDMMKVVKALNKESTIAVEGTVRERASKNPKQPTGDIEVVPTKIEVLGRCRYNELPFEINRSREADETQRLKYRYLDLRNPAVKKNIILRCNVIAALRKACDEGRNPRDAKVMLAKEIVERFHSKSAADAAEAEFNNRFRQGAMPSDMPEVTVTSTDGHIGIGLLIKQTGLVPSTAEANRNIDQGGVRINGEQIRDRKLQIAQGESFVLQVGKRKWAKVTVA